MASIPQELESILMALPRDDRAEIARRLIASLDEDDLASQAEVRARVQAYRDGTAQTVPAETVFAEARARLKR